MTTPLPLGLPSYISPATLQNAPTGIDWTTIPSTPSFDPAANNAEMWNMCARATSQVDTYCNQVLRATIDTELLHGPDFRVTNGPAAGGGYQSVYWGKTAPSNARLLLSRRPVLSVLGVQICPNNQWPRQWTALPSGYFEPEMPPIGIYGTSSPGSSADGGQAVLVGGGYINWNLGRNGWAIQISYINGWPHTAISAAAAAGATTLTVDDITGWGVENYFDTFTGATGVIHDGAQQEAVHVTSVTPTSGSVLSGPGTLTLSSAIAYPHQPGTILTTLPQSVQKACILIAAAEALTRGATSTTIHSIGGHAAGGRDGEELLSEAELLLHPFRRVI